MSRKNKLFKRITILMTLVFSFFLTLIPNTNYVNASSTSINQDYVDIYSIVRDDDTIIFETTGVYTIDSITYEITHYEDNQLYADLITDAKVAKVSDYKYLFEVPSNTEGVKIWKIKYQLSSEYLKNKMTTGKNTIGNVDAVHRKNYVEVVADLLDTSLDGCSDSGFFEAATCSKLYVFYFNLDTEIDWIVDLSMEYAIKTVEKKSWFHKETTSTKSYEVKLDHETEVIDWVSVDKYMTSYLANHTNVSMDDFNSKYDYAVSTYKRSVLGENTNDNGYDWYVQPLIDHNLKEEEYFANWGYYKEFLQEVAIVKMSYYSNGKYFTDIPVLDEDTGWLFYDHDESVSDFIWDNIDMIVVAIVILIIIVIIVLINRILHIFKLDKDSRDRRRMQKEMRELRQLQRLELEYKLINNKKNSKNKKRNKRYRR